MAWKIEQWMRDVFPSADRIYEEHRGLPRRELAITAGAVFVGNCAHLTSENHRS